MIKSFKYRLYPTEEQKVLINNQFGYCRFVCNWALEKKIKAYETDKTQLSGYELIKMLPKLKQENPWLSESCAHSLQSTILHLEKAFTFFFRKTKGFPKFKSKKNPVQSCTYAQPINIDFNVGLINLPKIGKTKIVFHRTFVGKIGSSILSKTPSGKYFISIIVKNDESPIKKKRVTKNKTMGIDLGLTHLIVLSNGTKVENPKYLRASEDRLRSLQRRMSKKEKNSKNRRDARILVAKYYEKVTNKRKDFLHKLTYKLVRESQATMFVCEDLIVQGMMRNKRFTRSLTDASWSTFLTMLQYKCDWYGKTYGQIGRFDATSKVCNCCGFVNRALKLWDRSWECPSCKEVHDRDLNASINIKNIGYARFQGSGTELKQSLSEQLDNSSEQRRKEVTLQ